MIRSMYTAISGIRNHQLMLDVTSDNIANVSTTGFKGSSVLFTDMLSQTLRTAALPDEIGGGTNPAQVGLGARVLGIVQNLTQGSLQTTGRSTDVAITGEGYFVVSFGEDQFYTRAGSFSLDSQGRMVTPSGALVLGWQADASSEVDTTTPVANLVLNTGDLIPPVQSTTVNLGGNLSPSAAIGDTAVMSTFLFDQLGNQIPLMLTFTKSAPDTWDVTAEHGSPGVAVALTDSPVTFDVNGEINAPADFDLNIAAGAIPGFDDAVAITVGGPGTPSRLTQYAGPNNPVVTGRNGSATGSLADFLIGSDGTIVGVYSNGGTRVVGRLALATFNNPFGLEKIGGLLRETVNSGPGQVRGPGDGSGVLNPGALELSNVDLAQEFTSLIIAQRGFQANTRVITTSDEVLQEIMNVRR